MPRRTKLPTLEEIARIPVEELAAMVLAAAEANPRLALRLRERAAPLGTPADRKRRWKERVRDLVPRDFVGYHGARGIAGSIGDFLGEVEKLAESDPETAEAALAELLAREAKLLEACDDSNGTVGDALKAAVRLWGSVTARAGRGGPELAEWLLGAARENGYGIRDRMVRDFAGALGTAGLEHLRERLRFELARSRNEAGQNELETRVRRYELVAMLEQLADALGDVDLFVEACRAGGRPELYAEEIARRRFAAGDAAAALATLDGGVVRPGREPDALALRLELLEALGRGDEAQRLRWDAFRRGLWRGYLDDYLVRLEDPAGRSAKESEAIAISEAHASAHSALSFLLGNDDFGFPGYPERAAELVRRRHAELDGDDYTLLRRAAIGLAPTAPDVATRLHRKMVEAVLERGESKYYVYAAKDLRAAERARAAVTTPPPDLPTHDEFVAALRARHGRKYSFWKRLDS